MKKYIPVLLSILILFTVLDVAIATSFHGTTVGSWGNVDSQTSDRVAVHNYDAWSAAILRWGLPVNNFANQFIFNGIGGAGGSKWIAETGDPFKIGDFSYRNERTMFSSTVNGVDLSIALNLSSPAGSDVDTFLFDFYLPIENTPNTTGDALLDADIVTITNASSPVYFNYLGTDYTLEVLGFSTDGGNNIITNFTNPEGSVTRAAVYGHISETAPVPEPATIFLLGVGLAGIVGYRINSKKKRS